MNMNWLEEPDCPECANGVHHEKCRSGWRDELFQSWIERYLKNFFKKYNITL